MNAGFNASINDNGSELTDVRLVFAGVSSTFHRATDTESYLRGRTITSNDTLKGEAL